MDLKFVDYEHSGNEIITHSIGGELEYTVGKPSISSSSQECSSSSGSGRRSNSHQRKKMFSKDTSSNTYKNTQKRKAANCLDFETKESTGKRRAEDVGAATGARTANMWVHFTGFSPPNRQGHNTVKCLDPGEECCPPQGWTGKYNSKSGNTILWKYLRTKHPGIAPAVEKLSPRTKAGGQQRVEALAGQQGPPKVAKMILLKRNPQLIPEVCDTNATLWTLQQAATAAKQEAIAVQSEMKRLEVVDMVDVEKD